MVGSKFVKDVIGEYYPRLDHPGLNCWMNFGLKEDGKTRFE